MKYGFGTCAVRYVFAVVFRVLLASQVLLRQVVLANGHRELVVVGAGVRHFDAESRGKFSLDGHPPPLLARMIAQAVLRREAPAEQRIHAERVADHRVPPRAVGANRERIEARGTARRRGPLERAPQIVRDRRRGRHAVAGLRRDVVGGIQCVVVETIAALEHGALADQVRTRDARHPHRPPLVGGARLAGVVGVNRPAEDGQRGGHSRLILEAARDVSRLGRVGDRELGGRDRSRRSSGRSSPSRRSRTRTEDRY